MSTEKSNMNQDKIISFEENYKNKSEKQPIFSQGFYHWIMFLLTLYTRVRDELKIDYESFIILQVVVSHSLYEINKTGEKSYEELESQFTNILHKKTSKKTKLTFASVSEVLQLPRETVRRKIIGLAKKNILSFNSSDGIKLGLAYKTIYRDFVKKTTVDMSAVIKKWKKSGALETLLEMKQ